MARKMTARKIRDEATKAVAQVYAMVTGLETEVERLGRRLGDDVNPGIVAALDAINDEVARLRFEHGLLTDVAQGMSTDAVPGVVLARHLPAVLQAQHEAEGHGGEWAADCAECVEEEHVGMTE